jgi:hypothetical protein
VIGITRALYGTDSFALFALQLAVMGPQEQEKQEINGLWEESSHEKDCVAVLASSSAADGGVRT